MIKTTYILVLMLAALPALEAQEITPSGPVAGFLFDAEERAIRPILGVAGSAHLGEAVVANLAQAAVAPDGKSVLAVSEGSLYLVKELAAPQPSRQLLLEGLGAVDSIVWNEDSSAAVLSSSGVLRIVRNLNGAPVVDEPLDASALGGKITALALAPAGRAVVAGVEGAEGGGVYLVPGDGSPARLVAPLGRPSALALARGGRDLFVADQAAQEILEIRQYADSPEVVPFAGVSRGVADPVGLALSKDERTLFVAAGSAKEVLVFATAGSDPPGHIALDFEPSFLRPVASSSLFLMNSATRGKRPFLMLDAGLAPAVYFVPAGTTPKGEE